MQLKEWEAEGKIIVCTIPPTEEAKGPRWWASWRITEAMGFRDPDPTTIFAYSVPWPTSTSLLLPLRPVCTIARYREPGTSNTLGSRT